MSRYVDVNDVVDFFLYKSNFDTDYNFSITPLKLQKLLYYAQAWNLVINDKPLFDKEIEAWTHGPVVPDVYHQYKKYGYNQIRKKVVTIPETIKDSHIQKVLENVWEVYGKYTGKQLEALTHTEKPWKNARGDIPRFERSSNTIKHSHMKSYYGSTKQ